MLACRPMLCFAVAVMAGVLAERFRPGCAALLPVGLCVFLVLAGLFACVPPRCNGISSDSPYARYIMPVPGALARRGVNRFILVACFGFFLLGCARQAQWRAGFEQARLPDSRWFRASLVAGAPNRAHPDETGRWRVPATLYVVDGKGVADVAVQVQGGDNVSFRRGDILEARVRRLSEQPRAFPGAFDFSFLLERSGCVATLEVVKAGRGGEAVSSLKVASVDTVSPWLTLRRWVDALRGEAIRHTLANGGGEGGMLAAMLYGYRKDTAAVVRDAFRRVGIGHILAISGLHVGMIVGMLWWAGGWIGWSRRWRAIACLVLSVFYLGLAGAQVAATRATLMAGIHLVGIARGRAGDMLNSLGAAAFFIVLANPTAPLDVSFQLSFTAVVFIYIALRRAPIRDAGSDPRHRFESPRLRWLRRELWSLTRLSAATSLGLFPIIAIVFHQVNVIGLVINIVVIPLMSFVLAGGLLLPWLGWIPGAGWALTLLARLIVWLAKFCDELPGSSFAAHGPSLVWVLVFYAFVAVAMMRLMVADGHARRRVTLFAIAGAGVAFVGMAYSMGSRPAPEAGRIALLPGRSMGSVVVEAANGNIAVFGEIRRGGVTEAEWLHYLHRGGDVAVVAVGKETPEALGELAYHCRFVGATFVPPTRKAEAGAVVGWTAAPGAEGVEYAYRRDKRGRLFWLSVRTGGKSATVISRIGVSAFAALAGEGAAGGDADVVSLGFGDGAPVMPEGFVPKGVVGVRGRMPGNASGRFFRRRDYGAIVVDAGVSGFDGSGWVSIAERRASVSSATVSAIRLK